MREKERMRDNDKHIYGDEDGERCISAAKIGVKDISEIRKKSEL